MRFKRNVYILTSSLTFSSANDFAVIFRDNNIGKIIGEPTGNQSSSYGMCLGLNYLTLILITKYHLKIGEDLIQLMIQKIV